MAMISNNLHEWGMYEARQRRDRRELYRSGYGVAIGKRRKGVRLFTPRSVWVSECLTLRPIMGERVLFEEFRRDLKRFWVYTRMTPDQFDYLHDLVREDIQKANTNWREAIRTVCHLAGSHPAGSPRTLLPACQVGWPSRCLLPTSRHPIDPIRYLRRTSQT